MRICTQGPWTVAVTLSLVVLLPLGGAWAHPVGFVAALEGDVEILPTGKTSWAAAAIDRDVEVGDTLRTGPGAAAKVLLIDETILTLGEETELVIDSYIVGANATQDPSVLRLLKGKARVLVGEAFGGPTRVEMHTPTAVIGVKGTEFDAQVLEDSRFGLWTLCCNLDGSVFVRQVDPTRGGRVEPRPGFCTQVFPNLPPEREIPRPVRFPPVRPLTTKPQPGTAESTVLGGCGLVGRPARPGGGSHRILPRGRDRPTGGPVRGRRADADCRTEPGERSRPLAAVPVRPGREHAPDPRPLRSCGFAVRRRSPVYEPVRRRV
jgi:hypothetical protein